MAGALMGGQFTEIKKRIGRQYIDSGCARGAAQGIGKREGVSANTVRVWAKEFFPQEYIQRRTPKEPTLAKDNHADFEALKSEVAAVGKQLELVHVRMNELSELIKTVVSWMKS